MTTAIPAVRRWPVITALGVVMIFTWGSTCYLMTGLASPRVGRMIAGHGGRPVLAAGCATIAAGLLVIAAAPALSVFWAGWLILGLGMAASL